MANTPKRDTEPPPRAEDIDADAIDALARRKGLTRRALGAKIGFGSDGSMMTRALTGQTRWTVGRLIGLARELDIPLDEAARLTGHYAGGRPSVPAGPGNVTTRVPIIGVVYSGDSFHLRKPPYAQLDVPGLPKNCAALEFDTLDVPYLAGWHGYYAVIAPRTENCAAHIGRFVLADMPDGRGGDKVVLALLHRGRRVGVYTVMPFGVTSRGDAVLTDVPLSGVWPLLQIRAP